MGGTLFHSKEFATQELVASDGQKYFEVRSVDGDSINFPHAIWSRLKAITEAHGMPREAWPEFMDHDFGISVSLEEVHAKQADFRRHISRLPSAVLNEDEWLAQIVEWIQNGEEIFLCGN